HFAELQCLPSSYGIRQFPDAECVDDSGLHAKGGSIVAKAVCEDLDPWLESRLAKLPKCSHLSRWSCCGHMRQAPCATTFANVERLTRLRVDVEVNVVAELPRDFRRDPHGIFVPSVSQAFARGRACDRFSRLQRVGSGSSPMLQAAFLENRRPCGVGR